MNELLFHNLRLLDPAAGRCIPGRMVHVRGDRFVAVGDHIDVSPDTRRIDLGGRVMMPGLIDCHVHIMSIKTKWANNTLQHLLPSFAHAAAARKCLKLLLRGFTTVRDTAGADRGHREAVANGLIVGPRLFVSGRAISQTGGHGDMRTQVDHAFPCACHHMMGGTTGGVARIADGVAEVRRAVRDEIRLGVDQIKTFTSGGVGSPADPIHFQQYSREELTAMVEEAENAGTYVMAHAYTARAIRHAVLAGIRTIEHGNFLDAPTADLMAERGAILVPTLVAYEATMRHGAEQGYPEENLKKNATVLSVGAASLEIARAAGVPIAFGTDLIGELDAHQCEEFLIRARVLSNAEIIRSATLVGAEVVRRAGEIGVIAPGAYADALVTDTDPLTDIGVLASGGEQLRLIMKDGEIYKNDL
jgi:imidazolonepropionase-like amidohydrolase